MRRDIGFFVDASLEHVYNAYLQAATNKPFERDCNQEPFHTISFGVNFSFKYNMNGGACTLHFMPLNGGTAVNMRFSLAQGAGARYEKYAQDLNKAMQAFLPVIPKEANFNVDDFLKPENQITPESNSVPVAPTPVAEAAPTPAPVAKFCANCGSPIASGAKFCSACGTAIPMSAQKCCPACNKPVKDTDAFCGACGTKL